MKIKRENVNFDKLMNDTVYVETPNKKRYVGFLDPKDGYNKLMAYGLIPTTSEYRIENISFLWVHKDYFYAT